MTLFETIGALVIAILASLGIGIGLGVTYLRKRTQRQREEFENAVEASVEAHDERVDDEVDRIEAIPDSDARYDASVRYAEGVLEKWKRWKHGDN